jgi:RNA recognition motif-containing protein
MRIYVGGLSFRTTESELNDFFAPYNPESVRIITDRETGDSRGFGFVEIADSAMANKAISEKNGVEFGGRTLQVNEARAREERGGGGRGPGGGGRTGGGRRW